MLIWSGTQIRIFLQTSVKTTESAYFLAKKYNVEMPITEEVYKTLFEDKNPKQAVFDLMTRGAKQEKFGV